MLSTKTTFFQSFDVNSQQLNHFCLFSFRNVKRQREWETHICSFCAICACFFSITVIAFLRMLRISWYEMESPPIRIVTSVQTTGWSQGWCEACEVVVKFELNVSGFGFWRFGLKFLKIKMISPCPGSSFSHRLASQPWTLDSMCFFCPKKSIRMMANYL